jgi:hypothetical protein
VRWEHERQSSGKAASGCMCDDKLQRLCLLVLVKGHEESNHRNPERRSEFSSPYGMKLAGSGRVALLSKACVAADVLAHLLVVCNDSLAVLDRGASL